MGMQFRVKNLDQALDLIPDTSDWNYLRLVIEPRVSSNTNLKGVVKYSFGVPSVITKEDVKNYNGFRDFTVGYKGRITTWEKVEIEENEPYWVQLARRNIPDVLEVYKITELEAMFGAYHLDGEFLYEIKVEGFDQIGKIEIIEGLVPCYRNLHKKVKEELLHKFGMKFGRGSERWKNV